MKIDLTDHSPVKKSMSIEIAADEVERETSKVLRGYRQKARIPGFRQGKAPASVIRARFAQEIEEDVRERVIQRAFFEAAREKGLSPLGDPALDEVSHEEGEPLTFKTTFEVLPEFEVKDYEGVEVRRPEAAVGDEDVDRTLEELRQSRAQLVVEEGRSAAVGDVVVADVTGTPPDAEPFTRERMPIEVGAENNLPAFNEHLMGVGAGEEASFAVEYPEDYQAEGLRGKTVEYKLAIHEVKRRELPELDDEFAKDLGEFDDLAALRKRIREDLEASKKEEADRHARNAVLDKVLMQNPIVLPEILVEQEVRQRLEEMARNMIMQGVDPQKADIDWEEMRKRHEEGARKSVHARLILDAIASKQELKVDKAAIDERIRNDAQRIGESPENLRERLKKHNGAQALATQMLREKSLDYLTSVANIQASE